MRFASPENAYLFIGLFLIAIFMRWTYLRRQGKMRMLIEENLLEDVAAHYNARRFKVKMWLLWFVFLFSIIALMRPQWGFHWQEVKREGLDIFVVMDVSKSMMTQDVSPNRLKRAKLAVQDLLKKLKGDRIGLIAFAGEAFMICPLTVDYDAFRQSLQELDITTIPKGGTNIGEAIAEALKHYKNVPNKYKTIIIITDGENLQGSPMMYAQKAKQAGIKIFCVGVGTKEGELIRIRNENGEYEFVKDKEGHYVKSRLNEKLLQDIALTTGGIYVKGSGSDFGLEFIYDKGLALMERRELEGKRQKVYQDRFQYPLALALLLFIIETAISTRKR